MDFQIGDRIVVPNTVYKYMERGIDLEGKIGTVKGEWRSHGIKTVKVKLDDIDSPASGGGWFYLQKSEIQLLKNYNKLEEEVKMGIRTMDIIGLWYERESNKIYSKFELTVNGIRENDDCIKIVKEKIEDINLHLKEFEINPINISYNNFISKKGEESIHTMEKYRTDDIDKLRKNKIEILAMLSACDTYEQEMTVLENYGIIIDGKLVQ